MLAVPSPVRVSLYVVSLGLKALILCASVLLNFSARILFSKNVALRDVMDSGDSNNISVVPETEESKGGIKFELLYSEPTSPPPSRTQPLSPKSMFSVENIDNKLKAANDRRKTIEAVKQQLVNEKNTRIEEVNLKKQEQNDNFKHQSKIQLETKIVSATEARESQIAALLERLREHDKHIAEVRKQLNEQTDQLRGRLQKKLEQAQEKRLSLQKDLQEKQTEHLQHVQEIRKSKVLRSSSSDNMKEGNENQILFSG